MTSERSAWVNGLLIAALIILICASVTMGPAGVPSPNSGEAWRAVLFEIRIPRTIAAALTGALLGISGAAMQALLRNPLADPGVLGISATATLGATVVLYYGLAAAAPFAIASGSILGAALGAALLIAVGLSTRSLSTLILTGVGLSSFCGAIMALVLSFAPNPMSLSDLVNWTLGSVANRSSDDILRALPIGVAGMALLWSQRRSFTALSLGETVAASLGVALSRVRIATIAGTALAVGASVALAGAIGFVGIVAPHLGRPWVRHDPGSALIPSALMGAILLVIADAFIRLVPTPGELRLGVVAALFGAPVFAAIILRRGSVHG